MNVPCNSTDTETVLESVEEVLKRKVDEGKLTQGEADAILQTHSKLATDELTQLVSRGRGLTVTETHRAQTLMRRVNRVPAAATIPGAGDSLPSGLLWIYNSGHDSEAAFRPWRGWQRRRSSAPAWLCWHFDLVGEGDELLAKPSTLDQEPKWAARLPDYTLHEATVEGREGCFALRRTDVTDDKRSTAAPRDIILSCVKFNDRETWAKVLREKCTSATSFLPPAQNQPQAVPWALSDDAPACSNEDVLLESRIRAKTMAPKAAPPRKLSMSFSRFFGGAMTPAQSGDEVRSSSTAMMLGTLAKPLPGESKTEQFSEEDSFAKARRQVTAWCVEDALDLDESAVLICELSARNVLVAAAVNRGSIESARSLASGSFEEEVRMSLLVGGGYFSDCKLI